LVCNWLHSDGQNHLIVIMPFNRDSAIQKCFRKILNILQVRKFVYKLRTSPAWIRPNDSAAHPNDSQCSIKFQDFFPNTDMRRLLQPSGQCGIPSERASIRYGNCVHLINHPNDHPPSPDARSLYMEITCSGCATVRTTVHHRPDAALKQERSSSKFFEFWSHSSLSGRPMTTVWTAPNFISQTLI